MEGFLTTQSIFLVVINYYGGIIVNYMGGKFRTRKHIIETILSQTERRNKFVEPFCGGGWITKVASKHFDSVYASDLNEDVILYWKAIQQGWVPPTKVSEELYREVKAYTEPSALRAHVMINCSFGGKWGAGYARQDKRRSNTYADSNSRRDTKDGPLLDGVIFAHHGYQEAPVTAQSVVYCDPPYADTTGYMGVREAFDSAAFWRQAQRWAVEGADVFVSEYTEPDLNNCLTEIVWQKTEKIHLRRQKPGEIRGTSTELLLRVIPSADSREQRNGA